MKKILINLDRSLDRLRRFGLYHNMGNIERFTAVDGLTLSREKLISDGVIAHDVPYTLTALGCYLSHTALWRRAVEDNEPLTIIEDDAFLSVHFDQDCDRMISVLGSEWDFIMWGWCFDSYLTVDLVPGVSPARVACFQDQMRKSIPVFREAVYDRHLLRLLHGMGLLCYSISPRGAKAMLDFCVPLRRMVVDFRGFGVKLENRSVDRMMNAKYRSLKSFVSVPPLAVSENDKSKSTIENS